MTDTPSIPPALTPEEWAKGVPGVYGWDDGSVFLDWGPKPSRQKLLDSPHAIAAACLYGQPFGFTQEEADALCDLLNLIDRDSIEDIVALSLSALAKIAALLPPK